MRRETQYNSLGPFGGSASETTLIPRDLLKLFKVGARMSDCRSHPLIESMEDGLHYWGRCANLSATIFLKWTQTVSVAVPDV
jgi:hypothetical protein